MNFQSLLATLKKNYIIAASGAVVLACFAVHFVRNEQITRMEADYDDLSVRRSRILKNMKFGDQLEPDLAKMKEMMGEIEKRLFLPSDLATNQRYFYQLESATGVTISGLQQIVKPPPSGKATKKARKLAARAKYQAIVYDMNVSGSYEQIVAFLRELEGGDAFACVDGFSVIQHRGKAESSGITMRLAVEVLGKKA